MIKVESWHNKALLSDKFSAALQICRRANTVETPTLEGYQELVSDRLY